MKCLGGTWLTFAAKDCVVKVDSSRFDAPFTAGDAVGYPRALPLTPEAPIQSEGVQ